MKSAPLIEFDEDAHRYKLNGKPVPSVTTVLDWALAKFDMVPPEILEAARVFGNHVHQACHLFNIGDLEEATLDDRLADYLAGYKLFLLETGFKVLESETRLGSVKYGYCGTDDIFGTLRGKVCDIDIKSTSSLPRTVGPQVAAYAQARLETFGQRAKARYCLHLKPKGYRLVELTGVQDFTWFVSTLNVWRWWNSPASAC